ncbi:MAG: hypothetical protein HY860_04910 [Chlamydiales bacterium]|nr:hypothetical protein [Chlamydiales bacterium]
MKKTVLLTTMISLGFMQVYGVENDNEKYDNQVSMTESSSNYLGFAPDDSVAESIATSMVGWGLGMAIAIGVISLVIKPSNAVSNIHSTPTPGPPVQAPPPL